MNNDSKIELLVDGEIAFKKIIESIRNAKKSILINIFIWRDDKIGNIMAKEVYVVENMYLQVVIKKYKLGYTFEKAEENKQSFFHKDFDFVLDIKSKAVDFMYPMKEKAKNSKQRENNLLNDILNHPNIEVFAQEVRSDHSKYYIFDGSSLIMGGMNIEDRTIYTDVQGRKYNDYMIKLEGEEYVSKFTNLLEKGIGTNSENLDFLFNVKRGNKVIYEAQEKILNLLSSAEKSIDIMMAYLGDKLIIEKIIELANNGIEIKMIIPSKANIQNDLNMKVIKFILEKTNNKVKVYLSPNMLHAKLMVIDGKVLSFGSTNFNKQATQKLSELNIVLRNFDDDFNNVLAKSINDKIRESKLVEDPNQIKYSSIRANLESRV